MRNHALILLALFLLFNCQSTQEKKTNSSESTKNPAEDVEPRENNTNSFTPRDPTDDEILEYGIITSIEEANDSMFVVSVSFPERQQSYDFNLNIEEAQLSHERSEFIDQYATLYYDPESMTIAYSELSRD